VQDYETGERRPAPLTQNNNVLLPEGEQVITPDVLYNQ